MDDVLRYIRRMVEPPESSLTDSHLLQRYVRQSDGAAFEALVRRHGGMVLAVCRRILGSHADAEDAFQAAFLVLIRKAPSLKVRDNLGNWLYAVAYRTAQEARRSRARRRVKEAAVVARTQRAEQGDELRAVLDTEIAALPEKLREIVVLCELEARSRKEVASLLGCPEGTVASRLARARTLLAKRLTRQGHTLSVAAMASVLADQASSAPVPVALATSLLKIAASGIVPAEVGALAQGVLKAMFIAKLQGVSALVLVVGLVGTGSGWLYYRQVAVAQAAAADTSQAAQPATAQSKPVAEKPTVEQLQQEIALLKQQLEDERAWVKHLRSTVARLDFDRRDLQRQLGGGETATRGALFRGQPAAFWLKQLKDRDPEYRQVAIRALGELGQADQSLIRDLIDVLYMRENDPVVVVKALASLTSGPGNGKAVPALIEVLKETKAVGIPANPAWLGQAVTYGWPTRWIGSELVVIPAEVAVVALEHLGPHAKAAIPALKEAAKNPDLQRDAERALRRIDRQSQDK